MSTTVIEEAVAVSPEDTAITNELGRDEELPGHNPYTGIVELYSRFITPVQPSASESGSCGSCDIPINALGGYQVEGLGLFNNRLCIEQGIFYKDDPQRTESKAAHLGSGELLQSYLDDLRKSQPLESSAQASTPHFSQNSNRLCANDRCKKGPNNTRNIVISERAKYCSASCRVAVCRRDGKSKGTQTQKPDRKRRADAQYENQAERQRAYAARKASKRHSQPVTLTDNTAPDPA